MHLSEHVEQISERVEQLSGRAARAELELAGFSSRHARLVLSSGLVGAPVRTGGAHRYDADRVHEVAGLPTVHWDAVTEACPGGIVIARRDLDASLPRAVLIEQLSCGWDGWSPWTRIALRFRIEESGGLPFVATVAGLVVLGADIVGTRPGGGLELAAAGSWFDELQGVRLLLGPGRPWVLQLPPSTVGNHSNPDLSARAS